mmetsp:Transcript_21126/g.38226  ORF Transcript_21126/g.38226 Transcript_21126/m.38226 type:complete len:285 (+) Transcript_21126:699-1553(+)
MRVSGRHLYNSSRNVHGLRGPHRSSAFVIVMTIIVVAGHSTLSHIVGTKRVRHSVASQNNTVVGTRGDLCGDVSTRKLYRGNDWKLYVVVIVVVMFVVGGASQSALPFLPAPHGEDLSRQRFHEGVTVSSLSALHYIPPTTSASFDFQFLHPSHFQQVLRATTTLLVLVFACAIQRPGPTRGQRIVKSSANLRYGFRGRNPHDWCGSGIHGQTRGIRHGRGPTQLSQLSGPKSEQSVRTGQHDRVVGASGQLHNGIIVLVMIICRRDADGFRQLSQVGGSAPLP